ncbi:hypothetical protein D3C77_387160 [compost metagenome]
MNKKCREVVIGGNTYEFDPEKETLTRYNEKTKMWVTVSFGNGGPEILEKLLSELTDEYIKQHLEELNQN